MVKVITAPQVMEQDDRRHVFLAGGITGCADWQRELIRMLGNESDLTLHNPRRDDFPIDDPTASHRQIEWEYWHLRACDAIAFWFSPETLNPIVLYELGAWSMTKKPLYVGIHPDYKRRQDVEIQTQLARPDVRCIYSLDQLAAHISVDTNVEIRKRNCVRDDHEICKGCRHCLDCWGCDCDDSHPPDCTCRECVLVRQIDAAR